MNYQLNLFLIRHTEPLIAPGVCYGQLDCDVADDYASQLSKIEAYFKDKKIHGIYSSPLRRCAQLAEDLAKQLDSTVIYKTAFKEIHFGEWEGKNWDDIGRAQIDAWNDNRLHFQFPGGESPHLFIQRVLHEYALLQSEHLKHLSADKTLVLVAHAGVIRTILADILNLPFSDSLNLAVDKASISLIRSDEYDQQVSFINTLP